ncbi:MAG: hypothetical protein ABIL16_06070 [candidate division WOR-3 bacterium]
MERREIIKVLEECAEKVKEGVNVLPKDVQPALEILKNLSENSDNEKVRFYSKWVLSMVEAKKIDADIRRYMKKVANILKDEEIRG